MYGPSECTVWCTSQTDLRVDSLANNIGKGSRSAAMGNKKRRPQSTGSGWIGYLNPEQTKQSFVENPSWAVSSSSERRRFYKTGDLVKFNADGTLSFIGRKDTQIKLHGRRIEIGEIEHHLASHSLVQQSMVMFPSAGVHAKRLVAIVVVINSTSANTVNKGGKEGEASIVMAKDPCTSELAKIKEFISSKLPSYMLPQAQPKEGKEVGEAAQQDHHSEEKEYDQNDDGDAIEKRLRDIWGQVLNIGNHGEKNMTDDVIPLDQTFSGLGGDSFSAMDLVARCRAEGLVLTVQDVLSNSSGITIQQMARVIKKHRSALTKNISMMAALKLRPVWWDA
ncbi:gramicidin S synthetase 1 [Coccidioides immitis RMSCC 3703]|uniref:Gramicidin S synthetase 1 n=1 Tax=Coccidioides immitis RMSCC 3703 TaxID=454286 RepID=A0A0J8QIB5_COCIT|nr:gramicidin S synthetase 1 [Coccidioides immitis RMSCC 3703]